MAALQADQLDGPIWRIPVQRVAEFEGDQDFYIQENPTGNMSNIAMIVTEPPYDNPLVRQALKELADREQIIAVVLQGHGSVSCNNPVRPFDQYFLPSECPQNVELARDLLGPGRLSGWAGDRACYIGRPRLVPESCDCV